MTLPPIPRPNGKLYRPREIAIKLWEDEDSSATVSAAGVLVLGTHDLDHATALATEEIHHWYDPDLTATRPQLGWWTLTYTGNPGRLVWDQDPEHGRAGIMFTADHPEAHPMTSTNHPTPDTAALPQAVIDEAWSEFLYPRAAVDDLSSPQPTGGFMRAVRVFQQWAERAPAAGSGSSAATDDTEPHLAVMAPHEVATECDCMAGQDHVGPWEGPDYDQPQAGGGDE